ncbi:hypothetical protein QLL95_gp0014 [Cotonvirus japonicus]|uniref:Bro-N domain-containing protein n=1 Tax=Cotonvirus japonicus TaxID=2811091 RepID=A0ABM7NQR7_9VIRU|nr:hypothetical protein QLL95_gp0014 [Cotonvirus japonicus]BCS82503.1 hypothetical protein [Cotonvirus japonicus]
MDRLNKIKINKKNYYLANEVCELKLPFTNGCVNGRAILDKYKIKKNDYIYASNRSDKWIITDGKSKKFDKLLIEVSWFENNLSNKDEYFEELGENLGNEKNEENEENEKNEKKIKYTNPNGDKIIPAPGIIRLKTKEKIKDNEGNILEIEVRGTREFDNCFFRMSDIAGALNMTLKQLRDCIVREAGRYECDRDYKYFLIKNESANCSKNEKNKKIKWDKIIFFTFEGFIRYLFASNNKKVSKYIRWCIETIFISQLGTQEQKNLQVSKLLGISADIVKEVFNKTSSTLPSIYLLTIGQVKDLRVTFNIDDKYGDDYIVAKGGETINLTKRIDQHNNTYGKMPGVNLCLKWFNFIDPQFTSKAETELFNNLRRMKFVLDHDKYKEIIIFHKKDLKVIKDQYDAIANKYLGHFEEISNKIKELSKDNENLNKYYNQKIKRINAEHRTEIELKNIEIKENEKIISELKSKIEIQALNNKLLEQEKKLIKQTKIISKSKKNPTKN